MARKPIQHDNSKVVEALGNCRTWGDAARKYSFLDDVLAGACQLDLGGNTRPLSMRKLYPLLASLPVISTEAVRAATGFSKAHAAKVRLTLQVASSGFLAQLAIQQATKPPTVQAQALAQPAAVKEREIVEPRPMPTVTPQEALNQALRKCREEHGTTLHTALKVFDGDIGAVFMCVLGRGDNPKLVEAGVLLVEHDPEALIRPELREPAFLRQSWAKREKAEKRRPRTARAS